jgi:shikimate kinase
MPGCGKTSTGKKLAKHLNWQFIDLDSRLIDQTGKSIAELFETIGEPAFRKIEQAVLFSCLPQEPSIIACGGGTPAFEENMSFINKNGLSIYLKANERFLWDRLRMKNQDRPLFKGLSDTEIKIKIAKLLTDRGKYYEQAQLQIVLPYSGINTLVNNILDLNTKRGNNAI